MSEEILHRVEDGIARIVLNRPTVGNALAPEHRQVVGEHLDRASRDADVRVVVVSATGSAFCTGGDLSAPAPDPTPATDEERPTSPAGVHAGGANAERLIESILDCEKPVVAAVNGTAAGLGAHLAFACDLVVAASESSFVEVFIRRGLVPDAGGAYLLPRLIGPQRTKLLMFFGDALSAEDAYRLGLVTAVVPA